MIANSFVWTENDYIGFFLIFVFRHLPYGQIVPSREGREPQLLVGQVKDAEISRLRGIVAENSQQRQTTELFAAQQAQTATLLPLLQQVINNTTKTASSTAAA